MPVQAQLIEDVPVANIIIRGKVISDNLIEVGGRGGDLTFLTPDACKYMDELPLTNPADMADLYEISFDDILDYLEELGRRLDVKSNVHMQNALTLSYLTAPTTPTVLDASYAQLSSMFDREYVREMADRTVGIEYLEGWVEEERRNGLKVGIRCFGARTLHIVAGNGPMVSALTIIRNAILRSDAIIKTPSNDPFTALAIAQTMIDMAPNHPITRHLSVGYWRGGDVAVEEKLYQPHNIEKIMAWGGYAAMRHVTQYIQPGLELVSLDPKRSASVIGREAFDSDESMREAAERLACDIGVSNQVGCVCPRVIYVLSGTDDAGLENVNRYGQYVYEAMLRLPQHMSTKPKKYDRDLKAHVEALRFGDWYKVIGGDDEEGAIIVSQIPEPVDFATKLADRTANLVPVDTLEEVVGAVDAYTQTVGVYPENLKQQLLNILPLFGAQRFVSLGFAMQASLAVPQDGIEAVRRMGKWIINEVRTPETGHAPFETEGQRFR
jgi:hypothetical protein